MTTIRTRFAPSPTGYMHIGGMRTALFNWLWARRHGGTFILRIDDTDIQRHIEEAVGPILEAFRWLQLDWNEGPEVGGEFGPYFQSQRTHLYWQAAERLLAEGKAYRCFDPPEVIRADREAAEKENRSYVNVRRSLELSDGQIRDYLAEGRAHVIRLLVPREETVVLDDLVRGRVEWDASLIPDAVIMRSDGSALYNFATAVDDGAMQISHVVRAEEHLSNTPVQMMLHAALGNTSPRFAHIPYVAAPGSKEKLSKRKLDKYRNNPQFKKMFEKGDRVRELLSGTGGSGDALPPLDPVMVAYYQHVGYLPDALVNALARLGWSLDDKTEIMSRETIVNNFSLDRVVKSPAGFDPDKLLACQEYWMNQLSRNEKVERCLPYLARAGLVSSESAAESAASDETKEYVGRLVDALGERLKVFSDILDYEEFFLAEDAFPYEEKAFDKRVRKEGAAELLREFRSRLAEVEPFDAETIEACMRAFVEEQNTRIGQIIHPVRVAVTGKSAGPGLFDCLALLGRERSLARIDRALQRI